MIKVAAIQRTCYACPAQWSGRTDDGREIYIRYRWGNLSVEIDEITAHEEEIGGGFDGYMDFAELVAHTSGVLDWSAVATDEGPEVAA